MAGTQSVQADDLHLLGIPSSRRTVTTIDPRHDAGLQVCPPTSGQDSQVKYRLVRCVSVVRVRPGTSRSITDLLLTLACAHLVACAAPWRSIMDPALSGGGPAAMRIRTTEAEP